jgi:N-acetylneuraminate synthase
MNIFPIGKTYIIAEVGLAHDGSLGVAKSYIDLAAKIGADAVKFQIHIAEYESSSDEKFRVNIFPQDKTRYEYWKRTSFNYEQWLFLKNYSKKKKIDFLSSPFSLESCKIIKKLKTKYWKISSGEINNTPLLIEIAKTNRPIFLSTGMSDYKEIEDALKIIYQYHKKVIILQCTSIYPCPPEKIGLEQIIELKKRFNLQIGYSDHTGDIFSSLAAVSLGAKLIEFHITFSKDFFGPDTSSSLTPNQAKYLVNGIKYINKLLVTPIKKNRSEFKNLRKIFNKGIYAKNDMKKNQVIKMNDLSFLKPVKYMMAKDFKKILGKKLKKEIKIGQPLKLNETK